MRKSYNSGRIIRIYLDELPKSESIGMGIVRLITSKEEDVKVNLAEIDPKSLSADIVEFVKAVLIYKFPKLTRAEIEKMFTLADLRQTKVYQEAQEEGEIRGRQEQARHLILRLLAKRFKSLSDRQTKQISALNLEQLENLGDKLLDFSSLVDLDTFLTECL
jgi:predicted transposase YdaD